MHKTSKDLHVVLRRLATWLVWSRRSSWFITLYAWWVARPTAESASSREPGSLPPLPQNCQIAPSHWATGSKMIVWAKISRYTVHIIYLEVRRLRRARLSRFDTIFRVLNTKVLVFNTKVLVFDTNLLVFDTKSLVLNTKFIIFAPEGLDRGT